MKCKTAMLGLLSLLAASSSQAQDLSDQRVTIQLPGVTFTRALNGAQETSVVRGDTLELSSKGKRDNFRDPDGKLSNNTAPVLLTKIDNAKPFTLTAKVTPAMREVYDAGTLYVWVRDDHWLKMAVEWDERHKMRVVTVRTEGTSDDNNHDVVVGDHVFLKISSDTHTIGFYYSLDGSEWQLVRLFKNSYPKELWTGVSAQSPLGGGMTAAFEGIKLTQQSIKDFRMGQ